MYVDFITKIFRFSDPKLFSKFPILVTLINLGPLCSYSYGRFLLAQSVMQISESPLSRFTMKTYAESLVMRPAGWTSLFLTAQGDEKLFDKINNPSTIVWSPQLRQYLSLYQAYFILHGAFVVEDVLRSGDFCSTTSNFESFSKGCHLSNLKT